MISSWNILNALVKEVVCTRFEVQGNFTLDVISLEAGLYFLKLEVNGIQFVKHLLID